MAGLAIVPPGRRAQPRPDELLLAPRRRHRRHGPRPQRGRARGAAGDHGRRTTSRRTPPAGPRRGRRPHRRAHRHPRRDRRQGERRRGHRAQGAATSVAAPWTRSTRLLRAGAARVGVTDIDVLRRPRSSACAALVAQARARRRRRADVPRGAAGRPTTGSPSTAAPRTPRRRCPTRCAPRTPDPAGIEPLSSRIPRGWRDVFRADAGRGPTWAWTCTTRFVGWAPRSLCIHGTPSSQAFWVEPAGAARGPLPLRHLRPPRLRSQRAGPARRGDRPRRARVPMPSRSWSTWAAARRSCWVGARAA